MKRDPGPGEKDRRPTAVDEVMWRLAERRAEDLGVDFKKLVEGLSSRSSAWRALSRGATPQLLHKVEAKLAELEETRAGMSKGDMLREWNEVGAELLMLDDDGTTFREALSSARDVLAARRKLHEALAAFRRRAKTDER